MTVNKKIIENVKCLKKAINEISVYDLDVYTSLELYSNIARKLNEVIRELLRFEESVSDEVVKQSEKLLYLLGEGLNIEVVKKINEMIKDGTMDTIINHNVFNNLNSQIKEIETEINKITMIISGENIELKINSLISQGYRCFKIVSGEYLIKSPIVLADFVEIYGDKNTVLKTIDNIPIITTEKQEGVKVSEVYIHDLCFINNNDSPTFYQLDLCNVNLSKIERVKIVTSSKIKSCVGGIKVYSLGTFPVSGDGVFSINIDKCDLRNSSIELRITDNYVSNTNIWGQDRSFALFIGNSSQQISNCQFVGSSEKGGVYVESPLGYDVEIIKINNCYFDGSWDDIQSGAGLIAKKLRCSNISNNSFWHQKEEGIILDGCFGNTITNNNFNCNGKNNKIFNPTLNKNTGYYDIVLKNICQNNVISNNTFYASNDFYIKPKAIDTSFVTTSDGNFINSNTIFTNNAYDKKSFNFTDGFLVNNTTLGNYNFNEEKLNTVHGILNVQDYITAKTGFKTSILFSHDSVKNSLNTLLKPNGQIKTNYLVCNNGCILDLGVNVETGITSGTLTIQILRGDEVLIEEVLDKTSPYFKITNYKFNEKRIYKGDLLRVKLITSSDLSLCDQATITLNIAQ